MRLSVLLLLVGCVGGGDSEKPGLLDDHDIDDDGSVYGEDCNDDSPEIHPGAVEVCDPADVDEDCNGLADNADPAPQGAYTFYRDADGDGFGDDAAPALLCELLLGFSAEGGDCDDDDPRIHPDATEVCDGLDTDEDCDGLVDDEDDDVDTTTFNTWYRDGDGDGWGDGSVVTTNCDGAAVTVDVDGDCDDQDATINPGAAETWYDGVDTDCAGGSDDDQDGDGYDAERVGGPDCDDHSAAAHPGADEYWYDGVDGDCSGGSDYDKDGDGHDDVGHAGDDCDDEDAAVYPGAPEDGTADNNCDGVARSTPVAVADYDAVSRLQECTALYLDGTSSADPAGDDLTYAWSLVSAPADSPEGTDSILDPDDASPVFQPTVFGDYLFELIVTNGAGVASWPDLLSVTISPRALDNLPVADAGADQESEDTANCVRSGGSYHCVSCPEVEFTLDPSASYDADDEVLYAAWELDGDGTISVDEEGFATVTFPSVTPTHGGTTTSEATVELTITDCYGYSDTDTVVVTATCTGS